MLCIGILHLFRWKNLLSWFAILMIGLIHLKKKKKEIGLIFLKRRKKKQKMYNFLKAQFFFLHFIIVGVKGQGAHIFVYIGPGAQSEDIKQPKDR